MSARNWDKVRMEAKMQKQRKFYRRPYKPVATPRYRFTPGMYEGISPAEVRAQVGKPVLQTVSAADTADATGVQYVGRKPDQTLPKSQDKAALLHSPQSKPQKENPIRETVASPFSSFGVGVDSLRGSG